MSDKYKAVEAFKTMTYVCQGCGKSERIFNTRDKVTPFTIGCPTCKKGMMHHDNWKDDRFMGEEYKPPVGMLTFQDYTQDTALESAKSWVKGWEAMNGEATPERREEVTQLRYNNIVTDCCSCNTVRIT